MANRVQLEAILKFVGVQVNAGVFNNISRAAAGMPGPVQKFNHNLTQSVGAANNVAKAVRGVNTQLTTSQRAAQLFLQRMAQFAILLPTFATLNKSIQGGVKFLFDFDAAVQDIIRLDVGKLSGKFEDITQKAFKLSDAFGTSALEAVAAIKTFTQAGYDLDKATELANLSLLATKASSLDAASATEFLLAVSKQFKLEGAGLEKGLDALVAVEGNAAVGAKDIAEAYTTAGNSFAQFAKSNNDAIGLVAALHEQTRKSGAEIGTFFKTLQARIFAAGESRAALEGLGVSVQNLDGTLRPTLDVLNDLKTAFGGMTEAEIANASKTIAGARQFENLIAVVNSLDRANQISAESSNSAGAARQKEAIDAEKLSRRLDELIVAAQKLAFALGEAGGTEFFKNALKGATSLVDALTSIVNLLGKLKVPVLPILAPLALKGLGGIFGVGGGFGGGGAGKTIVGSSSGGGGGGVRGAALGGAGIAENTAALKQLSSVIIQITQELRLLTGTTAAQIQASKLNLAVTKLQTTAWKVNVIAYQRSATIFNKASAIYQKTIGSIQNSGVKFALQYALLTTGVTILTAGLNKVSDALGSSTFLGSLTSITSAGVQAAGQFAILGAGAAVTAGALAILTDSFEKINAALDDDKKATTELTESKLRDERLKAAPRVLGGGVQGLDFLQSFGRTVSGRTNKQLDFTKSFNEAFKTLSPATQAFIKNIDDLKQVLFDPSRSKETIYQLSQLDSAAYTNQEALKELRASFDENGKTTTSSKDLLNLFFHALGEVDEGIDKATGRLHNMLYTFTQVKGFEELVSLAEGVNKLGRSLDEASKSPEEFANGIDKLRLEAQYAKEDLGDAQRAFANLRQSLVTKAATESGLNPGEAEKFVKDLSALLDKPNNGAEISNFLEQRTAEERKFGEEFIKIDENRRKAVVKNAEASSSLENEIYKRGQESLKAQREAAFAAADAMAKFQNELIKAGTKEGNTGLTGQISKLKSGDVEGVLKGNSDLPKAIQDVINSTFVDGVKKSEENLSKVADETANSLQPIELRMASLREQIKKLGDVAPNTEKAAKKEELQNELNTQALAKQTVEQEGYFKSLEALRNLTSETKKAQEEAARAEAERQKKTEALSNATANFSKTMDDLNRSFKEFVKQKTEEAAQKQASAYEEVKQAEQGVLTATEQLATAHRDYISTLIQVNGVIAEAKVRANLLGRDIGMLNGTVVTFQDQLTSLTSSFNSVLNDSNMTLEQRIGLEKQLADQTLTFLKQASDSITNAGVGIFGQSAGENQSLQKGLSGLAFIADKLGGSFQSFQGMNPQQINSLGQELLNLPVEFRKQVLDALSALPSTAKIGGFNPDQLKQAIGQIGAGVAPEQGLPAIADLNSKQVDQLKILAGLENQSAKLQLTQVLAAQKQLDKAQEQLDAAKIQEDRAKEGFDQVTAKVGEEMTVLEQANIERKDLLQKIALATTTESLHGIESQAQLFADQNTVFQTVGDNIVTAITQAIGAKKSVEEAQTSLQNFNTMQNFQNEANGFIPNFADGNISPREAAGLLRAASREKRAMPHGANLAVANTHEAIIPMYKHFAKGNDTGSAIAAGINSIRTLDQTMVAAIAQSVTNTLSQINAGTGNEQAFEKIAGLLSDLNTNVVQLKDSNSAIKNNTAGLAPAAGGKTTAPVSASQAININLSTNQNSSVQITGLESLRDQLKQALSETQDKQAQQQLETLMKQLDPIFQALGERGIISSFGQPR